MSNKKLCKKLCIYHNNCFDGFMSATIVRYKLGKDNVEFYPGIYQQDPPDVTGRDVIIVDFSYKKDVIIDMASKANSILILDHHKTAFEELNELPELENITFIYNEKMSGATMTWDYFFPEEIAPMMVKHIEDRDLWKFEIPNTKEIISRIAVEEMDFDIWEYWLREGYPHNQWVNEGSLLLKKQLKDINHAIKKASFRSQLCGLSAPFLNCPPSWSSEAGNIMAQNELFAVCFSVLEDGILFNLRSTEKGLDVSELAKQFGGGGHKHAAGFMAKNNYIIEIWGNTQQ